MPFGDVGLKKRIKSRGLNFDAILERSRINPDFGTVPSRPAFFQHHPLQHVMVDVKTFRIFTIIGWEGFIGSEDHRNSIDETTSAVRKGGVFMSNHSDTHPTPIHAGEGTVGAAAGEPMKKSRILVIDDGRIVEAGTHESLLSAQGLYARLYGLQFRESAGP